MTDNNTNSSLKASFIVCDLAHTAGEREGIDRNYTMPRPGVKKKGTRCYAANPFRSFLRFCLASPSLALCLCEAQKMHYPSPPFCVVSPSLRQVSVLWEKALFGFIKFAPFPAWLIQPSWGCVDCLAEQWNRNGFFFRSVCVVLFFFPTPKRCQHPCYVACVCGGHHYCLAWALFVCLFIVILSVKVWFEWELRHYLQTIKGSSDG